MLSDSQRIYIAKSETPHFIIGVALPVDGGYTAR